MSISSVVRESPISLPRDARAGEAARAVPMDEDAFRAFYDRNARALWAYLLRITGDRELADDLLQEVFYRFIRAGANHADESHRRNSLFQIATNLARDAGRRTRRRPDHVQYTEEADPAHPPPDRAVAHHADLSRAMGRLKASQREMLWLAYGQGLSHREIAEALGLKAGSIRLLLFRARAKLASLMRGQGGARGHAPARSGGSAPGRGNARIPGDRP